MPSRFDDDHRPEVTEVLARVWDILRRGSKKLGPILVLLLAIALMVSGSYTVQAGEQAVIQTFGRESGKAGPGLHFLIP
ncbi:MAG TPA: hypothetical protein VGJ84_19200, partial [Polyangiaceae bacterium]